MVQELIQLPELNEIQELLVMAKQDIDQEVKNNPDLTEDSKLLKEVMKVIQDKLAKKSNFSKLDTAEKIDLAAHINFLHCLLEEFFFDEADFGDDFDDEDLEDEE